VQGLNRKGPITQIPFNPSTTSGSSWSIDSRPKAKVKNVNWKKIKGQYVKRKNAAWNKTLSGKNAERDKTFKIKNINWDKMLKSKKC
jgi:hypothetical protein